ncbi:hypothetical protein ABT354_31230 [Streptomyces sp. NPDC000594]|uniref:hypothetical protein n=1 Tax=Streptomyces sp. NPDC000594 TaxID=3154261 RepID=UPI00331F528B
MIGIVAVIAVSVCPRPGERSPQEQGLPTLSLLTVAVAVAVATTATGLLSRRAGTVARLGTGPRTPGRPGTRTPGGPRRTPSAPRRDR